MTAATILTLANSKGVDLLDPKSSDVDFEAYAEHLAKEKRFNGATPNEEYSVAEHLCRGCDAILDQTRDRNCAAYFSLHDAPEAVLKDITTPLKQAIADIANQRFGVLADQIMGSFNVLEEKHDKAIHKAAGLLFPLPKPMQTMVKHYDLVMFVTEWRDLMGNIEHPNWSPYQSIKPLTGKIVPWPWQAAKLGLLRRWRELLPALQEALKPDLSRPIEERAS